ncbi:hypothetical protein ElyMa_006073000 [Elysia marginata]|uniref:Uncharacterized protein n=1 Tax=Elysia marginata TaxID=1093978 RepID=A0AAV4GPV9_9GAST|nr:hypothetical protein ElyMa_006073000 [Elysia marginata]
MDVESGTDIYYEKNLEQSEPNVAHTQVKIDKMFSGFKLGLSDLCLAFLCRLPASASECQLPLSSPQGPRRHGQAGLAPGVRVFWVKPGSIRTDPLILVGFLLSSHGFRAVIAQ